MQKIFSGVVVPMITPLNQDLSIDVVAVKKLIKLFDQNNLHPLVLGTTGESCLINESEAGKLVETVLSCRGENQIIYAGLVGNRVDELVKSGNRYLSSGCDCVVATLPSYYTLTSEQMYLFYKNLADKLIGPLILYNIKATTQMSIPVDIVERLSNHLNIWGLKDSERNEDRMKHCINLFKDRSEFSYFCGWGAKSYESLLLGADGIVPSTGNLVPEMYKSLYHAALSNNWKECERWQNETDEVAALYQKDRTLGESLAQLKVLLHQKGICNKTMMPPLTEVHPAYESENFSL